VSILTPFTVSGNTQATRCCENHHEPTGFIQDWEFLK